MSYSVLVLGVAGGADNVYHGDCSSSFVLLKDQQPVVLVDLGLGVTRALQAYGYKLPDTVVITHNHSDHAGELPVVLRVEEQRGRKLKVAAASSVTERLKAYRMAEHNDLKAPEALADWLSVEPEVVTPLTADLQIRFYPAQHSECCYGFVIDRVNADQGVQPLLGYTGDSGIYESLYQHITSATVSIFDARRNGNQWHAGFAELQQYLSHRSYIIGHGEDLGTTETLPYPLLRPGQIIPLS